MKRIWNFRWVAGLASATVLLGMVGCASTRYDRTAGERMDDRLLANRVNRALNAQPVYKFPDVAVRTYRGVVQLNGFVATEAQRDAANEIANRIRGAAQIQNNLMIAPLANDSLANFIPGRETQDQGERVRVRDANDTNGVYRGGAPAQTGTGTGRNGADVNRNQNNNTGTINNDNR